MGGNYFYSWCFLIFLFFNSSYSSLKLYMGSQGKHDHYEVALGEQFEVELVIKDLPKVAKEAIFEGDIPALFEKTGVYMTTINGKSEIKYSYQVRFDVLGTYTIGPAKIMINSQVYQSNALSVAVSQKTEDGFAQKKDIFLKLSVDTEHPVVGQKVICTLSCFIKKSGMILEQIVPPHSADVEMIPLGRATESETQVDEIPYKVIEWQWSFIPKKSGELVIPAAALLYEAQNAGSFLFSFFGASKRITSNALILEVAQLPLYQGVYNGIGIFSDFSASITPASIKQGDAATLSLFLKGEGIIVPELKYELTGISEHFKYYAVAAKQEDGGFIFEYVLQGMEEGEYSIPEQQFTFFNTMTKQYETLTTVPLEVRVLVNQDFNNKKEEEKPKPEQIQENRSLDEKIDDSHIASEVYDENLLWFAERELQQGRFPSMPRGFSLWFFLIILCLLLVKGVLYSTRHVRFVEQFFRKGKFVLYILLCIRYRLYHIVQRDVVTELYPLFMHIIAYYYRCSVTEVYKYRTDLGEKLKGVQINHQSWEQFFESISHAVYTQHEMNVSDRICLYRDAKRWVRIFLNL